MRYFLEVAYKGTNYAGFQRQANANTIQGEVEKALQICCRKYYKLTGSSRTDAGVHASQNYFHVDVEKEFPDRLIYNLNSLLPYDISIKKIVRVSDDAHCRFHATSREYKYYLHSFKSPFLNDISWYYPYNINIEALRNAASLITAYTDFTAMSKLNTGTTTNDCKIFKSRWLFEGENLVYNVRANRFLRGMVRGLVGTMLQVARGLLTIDEFRDIVEGKDCTKSNFATPAKGLFLHAVEYPVDVIKA